MSIMFDGYAGRAVCVVLVSDRPGLRYHGPVAVGRQRLPTEPIAVAVLTFLGIPAGTDIVILAAGSTTVIRQVDSHPGTSYPYDYDVFAADTVVDVGFINAGFVPFYIRGLVLPRTSSSIPVALTPDRNFS